MEWSGQRQYGASPTVPFVVDGAVAGLLKSHGPLNFLKVTLSLSLSLSLSETLCPDLPNLVPCHNT